jgi:hypothetical protein
VRALVRVHPYVSKPPICALRALKGPGQSEGRRTMPALAPPRPQTVRHDRRYWSIDGAATSTILCPYETPTSKQRTATKLIRFHPKELAHLTERANARGRW